MEFSQPIAVVGLCVPERRAYASRLADATGGRLLRVAERTPGHRPEVVELAADRPVMRAELVPFVADVAVELDLPHLDLVTRGGATVICVVDAMHLLDDVSDGAPLVADPPAGDDRGDFGARARRAMSLLEGATLITFVNWDAVSTADLSLLMAVASHLNPAARVRLSRGPADDVRALFASPPASPALLERAGWVHALNGEHDPHMTDAQVTTIRYEQPRPFHPARLSAALDEIDSGRHGVVLRSAGFCRLATRAGVLARWDHVGSAIWIDPLSSGIDAASTGQDLAFTGLDLDGDGLHALLDAAAVTDAEFTAGPEAWSHFPDPLPVWSVSVDENF